MAGPADNLATRARFYDEVHASLPEYGASRVRLALVDSVLGGVTFDSALDVGCGCGQVMRHLHDRYNCERVAGIDISASAVKNKCYDLDVREGVAQDIPYDDDSFDLVCCTDVLEHIPRDDVPLALSELARVTRRYVLLTISALRPAIEEMGFQARHGCLLHETVELADWWDRHIAAAGLRIVKRSGGITHPNYLCEVTP